MGAAGHDEEEGTEDEDGEAAEKRDGDELAGVAEFVNDEGPEEIELLFHVERPEVGDVEGADVKGDAPAPESEVLGVGELIPLPAVPMEMEERGEGEKDEEDAVIEGKNADGAAGVEGAEEGGRVHGTEEDAGDEEAGEGEEKVNADPGGVADLGEEIEDTGAGGEVGPHEVIDENEEDGEAAEAVESGDVAEFIGLGGGGCHRFQYRRLQAV